MDGEGDGSKNRKSHGISSDASNYNISKRQRNVNIIQKEAISQGENASFFDENFKKSTPKINPDEVISGMWEDAPNTSKYTKNTDVEKSQLESIENLNENDIIRLSKEYLQSPEGQNDMRPYLKYRPSYAKNQVKVVFESGKDEFGKVYDPTGAEIPWDPSKPRKGQWDMGHIPGQKYSVVHAKYVLGMMTSEEFVQWYRDPQNYRPELPSTNRGHKHE